MGEFVIFAAVKYSDDAVEHCSATSMTEFDPLAALPLGVTVVAAVDRHRIVPPVDGWVEARQVWVVSWGIAAKVVGGNVDQVFHS